MHDRLESPTAEPSAFDTQQFKQQLLDHVKAAGGTAKVGGQNFIQGLVKTAFEALLEAEMAEHLGYDRHDPAGHGTGNSRNGKGRKTIRGDFGQVQIQTPRDRNGSFQPQIVEKRSSTVGNFADKIVSLYARGMSTHEIEDHLYEMYGVEASAMIVSRAAAAVQQEITEWQSRPLEKLYPVLYVDGMFLNVREGEGSAKVQRRCLYTVLAVDCSGKQHVLGLWMEQTEGARFWLKVFQDLKSRGVEDILILCADGLKGLPEAVAAVFPQTDVQLCIVHQIRNATKYVHWKDRKSFCADMRAIYTASTIEAAALALDRMESLWGGKYGYAIASWRTNWNLLTTFFRYPQELRTFIYTTNAIESLHSRMRKNTENRRIFPSDESAIRLIYLNIRNMARHWTRRMGWGSVFQQLLIAFPERLAREVAANNQ
jgi:transposase-like protein